MKLPQEIFTQHIAVLGKTGLATRRPSVASLLALVRPAAIARLVVAIIVWVAVQGVLIRRAMPHIVQEVFEAVAPAIAYRDSATAVIRVVGPAGVKTTIFHPLPCVIFDCLTEAMTADAFQSTFFAEASAGEGFLSEMILANECFTTAVTPTKPRPMPNTAPLRFLNNGQPAKSLSA